jgi:hypothetical protein
MADLPNRVESDRKTQGSAANTPNGDGRDMDSANAGIRPFGWGADLDPKQRPAVPMERKPARLEGVHWDKPSQQEQKVEVLVSLERPHITPVFGTTAPPKGMSGAVRRVAFGYSESDLRHWLLLLLADRINVGEGLLSDLARGHVPNVLGEMGIRAELKHNPGGATRKALLAVGIVAAVLALRQAKRRRLSHRSFID